MSYIAIEICTNGYPKRVCESFGFRSVFKSVFVGIEGVVFAYQQCLPQLKLYGPTNFSPIINHVAHFGREALQQQNASVSCKNKNL